MRQFWMLCAVCACVASSAQAQVTDFDKRCAATLYTAFGGTPKTPESITQADYDGLTRKDKNADGTKATYSLDIGMRDPKTGGDNRGYLRITKGEALTDAVADKWVALPKDPITGAEIYHRISKTSAGEHMQVAVRKQVGQIILTIAQRRLANEKPEVAAKELCDRFAVFLNAARVNGILGGQIKLSRASDGMAIRAGEPLPLAIDDQKESTLVLRLDSTDAEGNVVDNVQFITLRLNGSLGSLVKVTYKSEALKRDDKGRFVLKEPGKSCEVSITLPPGNDPDTLAALLAPGSTPDGTPVAPLSFTLGGKLK